MKTNLKSLTHIIILLLAIASNGCTVVKHLGPYHGKIIDAESGTPIEDAIVYVYKYTESPSPAGSISSFAGYGKSISDKDGYFKVNKFIFTFRPLNIWGTTYYFIAHPEYDTITGNDYYNKLETFKENTITIKKLKKPEEFKEVFSTYHPLQSEISQKDYNIWTIIRNIQGMKAHKIGPYKEYSQEYKQILSEKNTDLLQEKYSQFDLRLWEYFGMAEKEYELEERKRRGGKPVSSISGVPRIAPSPKVIDRGGKILVPVGQGL